MNPNTVCIIHKKCIKHLLMHLTQLLFLFTWVHSLVDLHLDYWYLTKYNSDKQNSLQSVLITHCLWIILNQGWTLHDHYSSWYNLVKINVPLIYNHMTKHFFNKNANHPSRECLLYCLYAIKHPWCVLHLPLTDRIGHFLDIQY